MSLVFLPLWEMFLDGQVVCLPAWLGSKKPGGVEPPGRMAIDEPLFAQLTGLTLATLPPCRWIICWVSSILSKVTKRTVLARLCRR